MGLGLPAGAGAHGDDDGLGRPHQVAAAEKVPHRQLRPRHRQVLSLVFFWPSYEFGGRRLALSDQQLCKP